MRTAVVLCFFALALCYVNAEESESPRQKVLLKTPANGGEFRALELSVNGEKS